MFNICLEITFKYKCEICSWDVNSNSKYNHKLVKFIKPLPQCYAMLICSVAQCSFNLIRVCMVHSPIMVHVVKRVYSLYSDVSHVVSTVWTAAGVWTMWAFPEQMLDTVFGLKH